MIRAIVLIGVVMLAGCRSVPREAYTPSLSEHMATMGQAWDRLWRVIDDPATQTEALDATRVMIEHQTAAVHTPPSWVETSDAFALARYRADAYRSLSLMHAMRAAIAEGDIAAARARLEELERIMREAHATWG